MFIKNIFGSSCVDRTSRRSTLVCPANLDIARSISLNLLYFRAIQPGMSLYLSGTSELSELIARKQKLALSNELLSLRRNIPGWFLPRQVLGYEMETV